MRTALDNQDRKVEACVNVLAAERRLGIPREVSEQSLRTALALDGKLDETAQAQFLNRVLAPATDCSET
jgi:hypothetical protein